MPDILSGGTPPPDDLQMATPKTTRERKAFARTLLPF